jgi:hypothetical protein
VWIRRFSSLLDERPRRGRASGSPRAKAPVPAPPCSSGFRHRSACVGSFRRTRGPRPPDRSGRRLETRSSDSAPDSGARLRTASSRGRSGARILDGSTSSSTRAIFYGLPDSYLVLSLESSSLQRCARPWTAGTRRGERPRSRRIPGRNATPRAVESAANTTEAPLVATVKPHTHLSERIEPAASGTLASCSRRSCSGSLCTRGGLGRFHADPTTLRRVAKQGQRNPIATAWGRSSPPRRAPSRSLPRDLPARTRGPGAGVGSDFGVLDDPGRFNPIEAWVSRIYETRTASEDDDRTLGESASGVNGEHEFSPGLCQRGRRGHDRSLQRSAGRAADHHRSGGARASRFRSRTKTRGARRRSCASTSSRPTSSRASAAWWRRSGSSPGSTSLKSRRPARTPWP